MFRWLTGKRKIEAAWGIEVGNTALKALCLRVDQTEQDADAAEREDSPARHGALPRITAAACDRIPFPRFLAQAGTEAEQLVAEAIDTFRQRHDLKGAAIGVSVPAPQAMFRKIAIPPVEAARRADVVKYEARLCFPFPLDELAWDFWTGARGADGLPTEAMLVAVRKEHVAAAVAPFRARRIPIDLVQAAPLAMASFLSVDRLQRAASNAPSESLLLIEMGTETTALIVTDGTTVSVRTVALGGNHMTRCVMDELKLPFGRAEKLKRDFRHSDDPAAVVRAIRPAIEKLIDEIQRSIGYFASEGRAGIGDVVLAGNGFKLDGLQRALELALRRDMPSIDRFATIDAGALRESPAFRKNTAAFVVPCGVALQLLGVGSFSCRLAADDAAKQSRRVGPDPAG